MLAMSRVSVIRSKGFTAERSRTIAANWSSAISPSPLRALAMWITRSVSARPGQIAFTLTRYGPISWANDGVNPTNANFEAVYAAYLGSPRCGVFQ
jgi:hypothetical protein